MGKIQTVSIVVPVYNEENTLNKIISTLEDVDICGLKKEIILVDDCSKDKSRALLKKYKDKHTILYHEINKGKGAALRTGFIAAKGEIVLIQDADLEYNPEELGSLVKPILEGRADVVYGSRFLGGRPHRVLYYWHYVGNKLLTTASNIFTNLNLTDMETCYKAFTKEVINEISPKLQSNRFGFEPEVTARIAKLVKIESCRIYEIGISYNGRTYSEGKKIGWKDGFSAIWTIIKFNLFLK